MKKLMRYAAFRALAPDTGAGDGGAATPPAEPSIAELADAAYDAANADSVTIDDEPTGEDASPEDEAKDAPKDDEVADAPKPEDDAVRTEDEEPVLPADVAEKYPALAPLLQLEAGLSNPDTAPQTLRSFVETVAAHYNVDPAQMLGFAPPRDDSGRFAPAPKAEAPTGDGPISAPKDWKTAGFASQAEYDAAPAFEQAGFSSQGEYLLAQRLDAMTAQYAPIVKAQADQAEAAKVAQRAAQWDQAVAKATPTAIALVKAETGWTPTAEQVLAAAREYPQIAAKSLSKAVQAAHVSEIVAHAKGAAKASKPKPLDLADGTAQPGRKALSEEDRSDPQKLADWAYDNVAA